jgi:AcrR family transcriptional regulator
VRRARLIEAMAHAVCEHGFAGASVAAVCARANVSRRSFYEVFDSREGCFLAVLDEGHRRASEIVTQAFADADSDLDGLLMALAALLAFFEQEPLLARVCMVESLAAGPWALAHRERHVASLTRLIVEQCADGAPDEPHPLATAGVMASVLWVVQNHLLANTHGRLLELLGPLMGLVTSPYLDPASVQHEIARAQAHAHKLLATLPPRATAPAVALPEPLLDPRAHRLRKCVIYLNKHPGASNRQIAKAIGIARDTQISSILTRLTHAGLLDKRQHRPGLANAWTLTLHGQTAAHALETQTHNQENTPFTPVVLDTQTTTSTHIRSTHPAHPLNSM